MRFVYGLSALACLLLLGCESKPIGGPVTVTTPAPAVATTSSGQDAPQIVIPPLALPISPDNTRIEFVGTHVGEKPDPRKGGFDKFSGKLEIDLPTQSVKFVSLDIETDSLWTEFEKLTEHLKSPDFFEVREYPKATFESSKVEAGAEGEGQLMITGKLTLHGVTKEITIPATIEFGGKHPKLRSEFTLDRSEFNMKFAPDKVENRVSLTVVVGEKTPAREAPAETP